MMMGGKDGCWDISMLRYWDDEMLRLWGPSKLECPGTLWDTGSLG